MLASFAKVVVDCLTDSNLKNSKKNLIIKNLIKRNKCIPWKLPYNLTLIWHSSYATYWSILRTHLDSSHQDILINQNTKTLNNRNKYILYIFSLESSVFNFWRKMTEAYKKFLISEKIIFSNFIRRSWYL